jgi:hypothetical protein
LGTEGIIYPEINLIPFHPLRNFVLVSKTSNKWAILCPKLLFDLLKFPSS